MTRLSRSSKPLLKQAELELPGEVLKQQPKVDQMMLNDDEMFWSRVDSTKKVKQLYCVQETTE